jgi:hypothetical protein
MTLILTHVSKLGFAMAADSAITHQSRDGVRSVDPRRAQKLFPVTRLHAVLAAWGQWEIGTEATDQWIHRFIADHVQIPTLNDFAQELAAEMRVCLGPRRGVWSVGVHVAGYVECSGTLLPTFYHVHDGPSQVLAARGITVDPKSINCNHDWPPEELQTYLNDQHENLFRNGDIGPYAALADGLLEVLGRLRNRGQMAGVNSIQGAAELMAFQIHTIAGLYSLTNVHPGIGGRIDFIGMNEKGIVAQGARFG